MPKKLCFTSSTRGEKVWKTASFALLLIRINFLDCYTAETCEKCIHFHTIHSLIDYNTLDCQKKPSISLTSSNEVKKFCSRYTVKPVYNEQIGATKSVR
jgi:hypothetical protein